MNTETPTVSVGLGTKVGLLAAAIGAGVAAVAAILDGDHSEETITGLVVSAFTVYGVVRSRGEQAAALYRDAPSLAQMDDASDEDDDDALAALGGAEALPDAPTDGELAERYGPGASPFVEPGVDGPMPEGAVGGKPGPGKEGF